MVTVTRSAQSTSFGCLVRRGEDGRRAWWLLGVSHFDDDMMNPHQALVSHGAALESWVLLFSHSRRAVARGGPFAIDAWVGDPGRGEGAGAKTALVARCGLIYHG